MIIATSGHIDHGKTILVKALTGVDADRLPEEKVRGISIDLGYAYHSLDEGETLGFIDVPGHERFIRNMLAGVTGVDYALLVIAADDGPMPQTEEHLAILDLLGISAGAVVVTKIDRVDPPRLEEAIELVRLLIDGTTLEDAPIFSVSGITGDGIDSLRTHLEDYSKTFSSKSRDGYFRLAIDRRFNIQGSGLVVTGSVFSGEVTVGDQLVLSPSGKRVRVRGIHAQNRDSAKGEVGQRCALNLAGAEIRRDQIHRGDWIVDEALHAPTKRVDARINLLRSEKRALKHWTPVHLHVGAADINARVAILDGKVIAPGESSLIQLVLDQPLNALRNDRLILRDQSARRTMAGGRIIDPFAPTRGRSRPERLMILNNMEVDDPAQALSTLLDKLPNGLDLVRFAQSRNLTKESVKNLWTQVKMVSFGPEEEKTGVSPIHWNKIIDITLTALKNWHTDHPGQLGPAENTLRLSLNPIPSTALFSALVGRLAAKGALVRANRQLRLPTHQPTMSTQDKKVWTEVKHIMEEAENRPLSVHEVAENINIQPNALINFLKRATAMGFVIQVTKNRFLLPESIKALGKIAENLANEKKEGLITAADFRDKTKIGRNMAIEVLEFFDKAGFTSRDGNQRRILKSSREIFGA